ncbi:MAG: hypothetical protein SFU57_10540 [Gemmatimonadales bacterium]|nr:hypothetical protein [Gemmatimonadales bacterium]
MPYLTFHDLMELRFVETFLDAGVKMSMIRLASHEAVALLGLRHLFQGQRFRTDGHQIIADLIHRSGEEHLLSLVSQQFELMDVTSSVLLRDVEFDPDDPDRGITRWRPLGSDGGILVDPALRFGAPVVEGAFLPTHTLAAFALAESIETAADWYDVTPGQVRQAIGFESWLRGGDDRGG